MRCLLAASTSAAFLGTSSCAAFQPQHVFPSATVTPPPAGRALSLSLSLHMVATGSSSATSAGMESYDAALKRAYSAASYDSMMAGRAQRGGSEAAGGARGNTATVSRTELKTTTDALNAALDELQSIRDMMGGSVPPGQLGGGQGGSQQPQPQAQPQAQGQGILEQQQQAQFQQSPQNQPMQTTQTPGQLQLEQPNQGGQMVPQPRRPTILTNSATGSSTTLGTPYKQSSSQSQQGSIKPLRPPTSGTNIDIDRMMVHPLQVDARYLPTASEARRMAKTEGNRMAATEAFGRGSAGYYGRRYGVWDSAYGYGPWAGGYGTSRYGTAYENSWQSYGGSYYHHYHGGPGYYGGGGAGAGYYNPGYASYGGYGPYSYGYGHGYDPLMTDYGWGNYYGDGRRNSYLWGSQRNGPDYYADTVQFAEGQREMDKERGRTEYARRREWQERRMGGGGAPLLPPGPEQQMQQQQQMQGQQQQQQQQMQQGQPSTSSNGAGAANSYLNSMGGQSNVPPQQLQQQQQPPQGPQASSVPQAQATATAQTDQQPKEKKFSYLESAQQDGANSALATSPQANPNANTNANGNVNANVGTADAPYAEAEQMPFRPGYDRYGNSYSDSRYYNPAYAPANGYWDPYFGYSNWGRYGTNFPYYGGGGLGGGYGGVRGGDWFSDQIRRSERERVYDYQARSRWPGNYGYYGGYGRNSWGDYTFTPMSYI